MKWTRVENDEYPKTYVKFEGKKVDANGKKRQYWIQDLTVDLVDGFIDEFGIGFLRDEILCKYAKMYESEMALSYFKAFHRENFDKKASLVCLTKNEQGVIKVVGLNAMLVKNIDDRDNFTDEDDDTSSTSVIKIIRHLYEQKDPFKDFGIDKYLNAVGLYVFSEFRGEGIGQEILNARRLLCQDLGIKTSLTFFTSYISQAMAEKAGFKDFCTLDYDKFPEDMLIPQLHHHTKSAILMYITY